MNFDITPHTIFLTLTGSRVYGTASEDSDYDYRGVLIPPKRYFLGCSSRFDQHESSTPDDTVIYGINKFLKLASDNNPNVLELLYIKPEHWVLHDPEWVTIYDQRDLFVSKKCFHTFRGYAHSQMRRVKSHRNWLLQGEVQEPTREDFGLDPKQPLPQEILGAVDSLVSIWLQQSDVEEDLAEISRFDKSLAMAFRQRMWEFLELHLGMARSEIEAVVWGGAVKQSGYTDSALDLLQREKKFRQAKRHYESWLKWRQERNPKRKEIEARCGFDGKHLSHCFRLMLMCEEILTRVEVLVERPDAQYLRDIRDGRHSFDELEQRYQELDQRLNAVYHTSTLQHQPARNKIEALGIEVVERFLKRFD